ncbi:hypothetical protein LPJ66_001922 [Kickxella alabastrina]|uniref:Uncharacterized protein n=1 Tax=Kickxella alabastrina TaxID=61397 RepID=A0ACC1IRZ3_9FUNG|nr:hypothetical protein LPJ66_001922 [Kickxella alabastrina]
MPHAYGYSNGHKHGPNLDSKESLDRVRTANTSSRSSIYEAFGGESGQTPIGYQSGDQSTATYLAQCYERLMKDTASTHSPVHLNPPSLAEAGSSVTAAIGKILAESHAIEDPLTYVFIFTNPRSGNQQGRNLMNLTFSNFRLRDRPDVQVQIYNVTDPASQKAGLHFLHQLQLRQSDRLLRTAFPEVFLQNPGETKICPSPIICTGTTCDKPKCTHGKTSPRDSTNWSTTGQNESRAWADWISEAAAQLESGLTQFTEQELAERLDKAQETAIKLHVWSAGGDGTVSATLQAMMDYGIEVGRLYFSCIPFGTGNDFSDALGWGRSVPGDAVGESMKLLNKIITERLDGYTSKLDIFEITFTTYDDGHIKHVEKDMLGKPGMKRYTCLMIDYFSLGVQGFVGSSFEMHRPGKRALNILMYTVAAAKWVFMKRFPPINEALESISTVPDAMLNDPKLTDTDHAHWLEMASEADRKQVMLARVAGPRKRSHGRKMTWTKEPKARRTAMARDFGEGVDADLPVIQYKPIEIDVQNVARFWGRDIDVWNKAHESGDKHILSNCNGVTDRKNWTPQYAGDGKVEIFGVRDIGDYALNQIPGRKDYRVDRLAQMGSPLALHFREPKDYPPRSNNPLTSHKNIKQGLLFSMCDGEFIEMYHPRDIIISRKVTLKAVGRSPETSRIVLDTIKNDGIDAVQMNATTSANKAILGQGIDVRNYVASPFQRLFSLSRCNTQYSKVSAAANTSESASEAWGSVGDDNAQFSNQPPSQSDSMRRSTFLNIRNSIFRPSRNSTSSSAVNNETVASEASPIDTAAANDIGLRRANTISNSSSVMRPPHLLNSQTRHRVLGTQRTIHKESPLKKRMSLADISEGVDVTTFTPDDIPAHRMRSKSFDINLVSSTPPLPHQDHFEDSRVPLSAKLDESELHTHMNALGLNGMAGESNGDVLSSVSSSDTSSTDHSEDVHTHSRNSTITTPGDDEHASKHPLLTFGKQVVKSAKKSRLSAGLNEHSDPITDAEQQGFSA